MSWIKPILVALIHFIGWTIVDIIIWGKIFAAHDLFQYGYLYHICWWIINITMILSATIYMSANKQELILFIWTSFIFSCISIEDVCYYWFDLEPIPNKLPWLNFNPFILFKPVTSSGLVSSICIWLIMWIVISILLWKYITKK